MGAAFSRTWLPIFHNLHFTYISLGEQKLTYCATWVIIIPKGTHEKGGDFLPAHFQYENPFNILASLIADLPRLSAELYQSKDSRDTLTDTGDWDDKVYDLLSAFPELDDIDVLLRDGMTPETVNRLHTWCKENEGFSPVLSLVCGLDSVLSWDNILNSSYLKVYLKDSFEALNDNWKQTGILVLPRVPSLNDPFDRFETGPDSPGKTWAYAWEPGINEELTNTYYVEKNTLTVNTKTYTVIHKVVRDWVVENSILFAASPIARGTQVLEPLCYESEGRCCFSIEGLNNPEYINRRVKSACKKAAEEEADLLIFPEMLGEKAMFTPAEGISDFFSQLRKDVHNTGYRSPTLILPPTWWHDKHNQLHVIDGDGGYICVQEKQTPFLYHCSKTDKKYLEDIQDTPPVIQVLHIPKVGRITFPICKDYLVTSYRELLVRALRSTLMLCPSYSKGKFAFTISVPAELGYGCYSLWINTCSALPENASPPAYVGLVAAPNTELVYRFEPQCGGQCGSMDDACLFLVEIKRTGEAPEITVRKHICPNTEQFKKEEKS